MLRAVLLILMALTAITSNIARASTRVPPPVSAHHMSHHDEQGAPCCDAGTCLGCAVVPTDLTQPARIALLPFAMQPLPRLIALAERPVLPDLPPPRS